MYYKKPNLTYLTYLRKVKKGKKWYMLTWLKKLELGKLGSNEDKDEDMNERRAKIKPKCIPWIFKVCEVLTDFRSEEINEM